MSINQLAHIGRNAILFTALSCIGAESPRSTGLASPLAHTNLMLYQADQGRIEPVRRKGDWERRRQEIVRAMQNIMGPLPGPERRCALDVKVERRDEEASLTLESITYASEPGSRVPAWLLIPKTAANHGRKLPGVLALHPTDMEFGNRVVVEKLRSRYPAYARELAERGFVVLAPAYPLMATYQPDLKALGYASGTMKAVWDNIRALDLLESLPFVSKGGFGVVGHSLGGHNAIFTAVLDPRIKAVASSCGFDSFRDYQGGNITGWTSERYMPRLREFAARPGDIPFDFYELIGALAPRSVFISAPLRDDNFNASSVDAIVAAAGPVFELYGARDQLILRHPDCAHEFPVDIREEVYQLLKHTLH